MTPKNKRGPTVWLCGDCLIEGVTSFKATSGETCVFGHVPSRTVWMTVKYEAADPETPIDPYTVFPERKET